MALRTELISFTDESSCEDESEIPFAAGGKATIRRSRRLLGRAPVNSGVETPRRRTQNGRRSVEQHGGDADGDDDDGVSVRSKFTKASSRSVASSSRSEVLRRKLQAELQAEKEINKIEEEKEASLRELLQKRAEREAKIVQTRLQLEKAKIEEEFGEDDNRSQILEDLPRAQISTDKNVDVWLQTKKVDDQPTVTVATKQPTQQPDGQQQAAKPKEGLDNRMDQFLARQTIPKELPFFSGDVTEWPMFVTQYERTTALMGLSDDENLSRLQRCLKGKAREAVLPILLLPENVPSVIDTLERMFGRTDLIIESMVEKVKSCANPKESKPDSLIVFSNLITNLVSTMKALGKRGHMRNPQLLKELLVKLPYQLQFAWCEKSKTMTRDPTMADFASWMSGVAMTASLLPTTSTNKNSRSNISENNHKNEKIKKHVLNISEKSDKKCPRCHSDEHSLSNCEKFLADGSKERWDFVMKGKLCVCCLKHGHIGTKCPEKRVCGIDECNKYHNRKLHRKINDNVPQKVKVDAPSENSYCGHAWNGMRETLLRVLPVILSGPKGEVTTYAFLDEGSTLTLVDAGVADQLGLQGEEDPLCIHWTNNVSRVEEHSRRVSLSICGSTIETKRFNLTDVRTVENLSLPLHTVDFEALKEQCSYLSDVPYESVKNVRPMILLGQDNIILSAARKFIRGTWGSPVASLTPLGWVVHGKVPIKKRTDGVLMLHSYDGDQELNQLVKDSFSTENFGVKVSALCPRSKDDEAALKIMKATTRKVGDRFETGLLWRQQEAVLPDSRNTALRRLQCAERRMDKDTTFASTYCMKVQEFIDKGYAELMTREDAAVVGPKTWYVPHFGVTNPNKPGKVRLVFDAAAKTDGVSLNSCLYKGPDLLNPLPAVLWRFRRHAVAAVGDIKEMFPQIVIRPEDQDAQRFLWRGMERKEQPKTYKMVRIIFGAASSPSSANYVKNLNASEFQVKYPRVYKAVKEDTYMDDHLGGGSSDEDLREHLQDVIHVYKQAGFIICNWSCSSRAVLETIPEDLRAVGNVDLNGGEALSTERVLGPYWNADADEFCFNFKCHKVDAAVVNGSKVPTKREVLKLLMTLFDPLGFLAHYLIKGKILFQQIWRTGLGWDDCLTETLMQSWELWLKGLADASHMKIQRCSHPKLQEATGLQLHTFVDASEEAFAAVCYLRIQVDDGVEVSFVAAKTKVAPLKPLSIPRMELQAVVLGVRLANTIKAELQLNVTECVYWSDSRTVLCWIKPDSRKYKQFVAHRVSEILESSDENERRWVPTEENVADEATRSRTTSAVAGICRWLHGPKFLKSCSTEWPKEVVATVDDTVEEKKKEFLFLVNDAATVVQLELLPDVTRFSKLLRLVRATAWVKVLALYWLDYRSSKQINGEDMVWAEKLWWQKVQQDSYPDEMQMLRQGLPIERCSSLYKLDVHLDDEGIMRMRGRISEAPAEVADAVNPVVLDRKHAYTVLLMAQYHCAAGHQGRETVVNNLRQKFYIPGARSAVRKVFASCCWCRMRKVKPENPRMADLPPERVTSFGRAIIKTGMDFFGPVYVKIGRRREKRYGVLFTCLAVRAIHLEVAEKLTTDSTINAVRRFIGRRGTPADLYTNNGRNLRGAEREMREAVENMEKSSMLDYGGVKMFRWHFIPPGSPHMGGSWERLVRSVKSALYSTLTGAVSEEVLATLFTEAEAVVNSRPLTHVPIDAADDDCLTPNHFLIGPNNIILPAGDFSDEGKRLRSQWKTSQRLADYFWRKLLQEYLPTLARRVKWHKMVPPLKVGDLVVIADNAQPRMTWTRRVIVRVFRGKDGQVRVADVRTSCGIYRRPANKLCLIDVES